MDTEAIIAEIQKMYHLEPLAQEGGLYRQTMLSEEVLPESVIPGRKGDHRMYSTILYLLKGNGFSRMHRLTSDEVFHFYLGDPVEQLQLYPDGSGRVFRMGQDVSSGELVQLRVPKGTWQGTRLCKGSRFALLGTTMAPAYEDRDYEDGDRAVLLASYPQFASLLKHLTEKGVYE